MQEIDHWLTDEQVQRVFWLNGLAGTGKLTIAQTFRPLYLAKATGVIYAKSMWPRPTRRDTYTPTRPRYSPEYPSVVECRISTKRRGGPVANMVSGSNLHLR